MVCRIKHYRLVSYVFDIKVIVKVKWDKMMALNQLKEGSWIKTVMT